MQERDYKRQDQAQTIFMLMSGSDDNLKLLTHSLHGNCVSFLKQNGFINDDHHVNYFWNFILKQKKNRPIFSPLKKRKIGKKTLHPFICYVEEEDWEKNSDYHWVSIQAIEQLEEGEGAILCEGLALFWDLFDDESQLGRRSFNRKKFDLSDEIIIYGGSFNPWHLGHEACIKLCPNKEKIVVVPDFNPLKNGPNPDCFFKFYRDIDSKVKNYGAHVYPGFCGIGEKNPTSKWLPHVKYPFSLLMGADSFVSLPKWVDPAYFLIKTKKIYLVNRDQSDQKIGATFDWLKNINPQIELIFLGNHPYQDLSSSKIRNR